MISELLSVPEYLDRRYLGGQYVERHLVFIFAIYFMRLCWRVKELGNYYGGLDVG